MAPRRCAIEETVSRPSPSPSARPPRCAPASARSRAGVSTPARRSFDVRTVRLLRGASALLASWIARRPAPALRWQSELSEAWLDHNGSGCRMLSESRLLWYKDRTELTNASRIGPMSTMRWRLAAAGVVALLLL